MAHILIIDDDDQIREMLKIMFEKKGYQVSLAENGAVAINAFMKNPADIILTDIFMPEKEGIEIIMELKELHPDLKIIAMSGGGKVAPEAYLKIAKRLGAEITFTKPVDISKLMNAVEVLVN